MLDRLSDKSNRKFEFSFWLIIFFTTIIIALTIQLVVLPILFPGWHAGQGLLANADTVSFHHAATEMAEKIKQVGWSAWELRPKGWMPAGVAAAVYALTWPEPWALIPLNALVHATTVFMIMKIALLIFKQRIYALIAALPFAFFPTAALWYAQIHRGGYHFMGIMLFLYGLLHLIKLLKENRPKLFSNYFSIAKTFIIATSGLFIVWLARPHFMVVLQYTYFLLFILIMFYFIYRLFKKRITWQSGVFSFLILIMLFAVINTLTTTPWSFKYQTEAGNAPVLGQMFNDKPSDMNQNYQWERIGWLPKTVDDKLYSTAYFRAVRYPGSYGEPASAIDYDRTLHNAYDFIMYLPRAVQIAFLAPFPNTWLGEGSYPATTFFRRITILEMVIVYLALPFLCYGLWYWKKKFELWLIALFCTAIMLPIVYAMPNVGAVHRYRYGYLVLLVGLGLAFLFKYAKKNIMERQALKH